MKFHAKISEISVPYLWGPEDDKNYRSCHEFTVENVKLQKKFMIYSSQSCPVKEIPSDVSLVAGKYSEGFLHGPASSLTSKSIIYPCSEFRCKIDCPCQLCRYQSGYCSLSGSHLESVKDCELCRKDYDDYMLHHRASSAVPALYRIAQNFPPIYLRSCEVGVQLWETYHRTS